MATEYTSDVCLILEGSYPYVPGGVSGWAHELIKSQSNLLFEIVAILPPAGTVKQAYEMPKNVVKVHNIRLQNLIHNDKPLPKNVAKIFYPEIELDFLHMSSNSSLHLLRHMLKTLRSLPHTPGMNNLMNSREAWSIILRMYRTMMGDSCFLDYFWSWRSLFGGLLSVLLAELPKSRIYHSISTGYAGMYMARAGIETNMPCLLTEHGIYTNERRIEISMAEWLPDSKALNFNIEKEIGEKTLRDFWTDSFLSYSRVSYEICESIVTLYEGNYAYQIKDGADPKKLRIIPNGIATVKFRDLPQKNSGPATVALVGRVVPIKDVKTYIRACALAAKQFANFKGLVVGPYEEDPEYYRECVELVQYLRIEHVIEFTGKKDLTELFPLVDLLVMTSISEAMPLAVLEAGAAGVASVCTDVGACSELIFGQHNEEEKFGEGGMITALANPIASAQAIIALLQDDKRRLNLGLNMRKRVITYYDEEVQKNAYMSLYGSLLEIGKARVSPTDASPPVQG